MASLTGRQEPLPVLVRVSVTLPAASSAAVGVYTAFTEVAAGVKVPRPPLQTAPVAPETLPASVTAALLAQALWSAPAFTTGASVKVSVTLSVTARQLPLPVVVSVSVTLPAAISAAVGV